MINSILENDMKELSTDFSELEKIKNSTILITGATGLIAKYLIHFFMTLNDTYDACITVVGLARNREKAEKCFADYLDNSHFRLTYQDVCEPLRLDFKADYIIHAAGSASAHAIRTNPIGIIKANTLGTINVMEYARVTKPRRVVYLSTREIYGEVKAGHSISETDMGTIDPLVTRNCYPESKRMGESILEGYHDQFEISYNVLRIAHTYGPAMELSNDGRVMADFINYAVNRENIVLNSDGTAVRSFCYITDTIRGIISVMLNGASCEAYNLANEGEPMMIRDVAQMISNLFPERKIAVIIDDKSTNKQVKKGYLGYKITQLDTSKIERLGWSPMVPLSEGICRTVKYFDE